MTDPPDAAREGPPPEDTALEDTALDDTARRAAFPVGAAVTVAELAGDPHPVLRRLREREPVSWVPALGGWLVTRRDLALVVLRDAGRFTVDDPRFTTARVVGPSMLSLDGPVHKRHRDPFFAGLREDAASRLPSFVAEAAAGLVTRLASAGQAELRRELAGPLAVAVVAELLGLGETDPGTILAWYDAIVGAVSGLAGPDGGHGAAAGTATADPAAGEDVQARGAAAFGELRDRLEAVLAAGGDQTLLGAAAAAGLSPAEVVSNAAVLMFGGIETTEGMICNAAWYLLREPVPGAAAAAADPGVLAAVVEESLRLEPAAAVVDRYATADTDLGGARVGRGDLVTVSLAGANRDPAFFGDPDRFDPGRDNLRQHLAFARGPHFCIGAQLAALEAREALAALLAQLPGLRLDPDHPATPGGLVFRKPPALHVRWQQRAGDRTSCEE